MGRAYTPRRAGKRWREGAPEYVLDVFDHPKFADRYTVIFGTPFAFHVDGPRIVEGPGTYANTYLTGLGTSESGGVSGSLEMSAHEVACYRGARGRHRIKWLDLPEQTRRLVQNYAERD